MDSIEVLDMCSSDSLVVSIQDLFRSVSQNSHMAAILKA